jgi:hypothetical protein
MSASTSKIGKTIVSVLLLFMTILGSSLFAQGQAIEEMRYSDGCLPYSSSRQQVSLSNLDIFATLLYWHATQTVDWAIVDYIENPNRQNHSFQGVSFGWDPGFKVGAGYHMEYDGWDTQFSYTWFRTRTSEYLQQDSGVIKPAYWGFTTALTESYLSGQLHWNIHFNMFDLDLGRSFWLGENLAVRPFIGLKGGLIDQTIYTNWQNPSVEVSLLGTTLTATENLKQNFRGIGPRGGIGSKWGIGNLNHVSLIGDFAAGFLWGHWQFSDHFADNSLVTVNTRSADRNFGALMAQSFLGLGFDYTFRHDLSHFSFQMGYEIQDWFSAYQLFDDNTGQHNNDLIFQGLSLSFYLDY